MKMISGIFLLLVMVTSGRMDGSIYFSPLLRTGMATIIIACLPALPFVVVLGVAISCGVSFYQWVEEKTWEMKVARVRVVTPAV